MNLRSSVPEAGGPRDTGPPGIKHQPVARVGVVPRGLRYARLRADFATTHPSPHPTPTSYKGASFSRPWLVRGEQVWGGRLSPTLFPTQPGAC